MSNTELDFKNLPIEWDFKKLFGYSDYYDPKIETDINKGIREIKSFARKWSKREDWLSEPAILKKALEQYFKPNSAVKPIYYLGLLTTKETTNTELLSIYAKYSETLSVAAEAGYFFELRLGKVDKKVQKLLLKSPELAEYKFWLQELFSDAKHDLEENQEKIVSRYSRPRSSLWIETLQKNLNKKTIKFKGKEIPHTEASAMVALERNTKKRRQLNDLIYQSYAELEDLAEGAFNAILLNKKISNDLRGYKKPYSSTLNSYQNSEKEVLELVEVVKDNYKLAHDYYRFKRDLMGLDTFTYADRNVDVGRVSKKYTYHDSVEIIYEVLNDFHPEAAKAFYSMVNNGQYDVFPAPGKKGGAFQADQPDQPTMVFLNHVNGFNEMMTLAHETGHALHTYFTNKNQPYQYQGYSTSVAEVASTFVENLVFYNQLPHLSEGDQLAALMAKMNNAINTIQRQIAFFDIELQLHEEIKISGHVSSKKMQEVLLTEFRNYLGKYVEVDDNIGSNVFMMTQAHFASPFYVYAYAYGELIAQALHQMYQADSEVGREAVLKFMSAGSSKKPKDIFRQSGIKIGPELWETGLDQLKSDLRKIKRLHKKLNKK